MQITTIAWNLNKEMLCYAHERQVKVVIQYDFKDGQMCNPQDRRVWIQVQYKILLRKFWCNKVRLILTESL